MNHGFAMRLRPIRERGAKTPDLPCAPDTRNGERSHGVDG